MLGSWRGDPFALSCGPWAEQRAGAPGSCLCPAATQDSSRDPGSFGGHVKPAWDLAEPARCGSEEVSQQPRRQVP